MYQTCQKYISKQCIKQLCSKIEALLFLVQSWINIYTFCYNIELVTKIIKLKIFGSAQYVPVTNMMFSRCFLFERRRHRNWGNNSPGQPFFRILSFMCCQSSKSREWFEIFHLYQNRRTLCLASIFPRVSVFIINDLHLTWWTRKLNIYHEYFIKNLWYS